MVAAAILVASAASPQVVPESRCRDASWSFRLKRSTKGLFSTDYGESKKCQQQQVVPKDVLPPAPWTNSSTQLQALQQLQQRMQSSGKCTDEDTLKYYLRDNCLDVEQAEARLTAMLTWKASHKMLDLTLDDVAAEFATGKAYIHDKLDRYNRPVVGIRANRHFTGEFPAQDSKRLCAFFLDSAIKQLPEGSDQILWVIDMKGLCMSNIDLSFVAFVLDAIPEYYPRRVGQILFVDAPWLFKGPWEAIKPLLRKFAYLVRFLSRKELAQEYFTPDTLPADFQD